VNNAVTCSRRLEWDSLHRVPGHDGACRAFHGHHYVAIVECGGDIASTGMIIDFGLIKALVGGWIDSHWDHTAILWADDPDPAVQAIEQANASFGRPIYKMSLPPTAEHLALELAQIANKLLQVHNISVDSLTVFETPNASAKWSARQPAPPRGNI
jgi:6-pyruvoyltetrahydropterin/6-carboxytetrahydropterin synthase